VKTALALSPLVALGLSVGALAAEVERAPAAPVAVAAVGAPVDPAAALTAAALAGPRLAAPAALAAELDRIAAERGVLGYSIVGVRDGQAAVAHSAGTAVVATGRPVTSDTAFRMASVSKVAAAVALMQQWEEGKFGLDEDISDVLKFRVRNPRHPDAPVTYRQLLAHTSGLKDDAAYFRFLGRTFSGAPPAIASLKTSFHAAEPGRKYRYSNLGYGLIGTLVEKHGGERFGDYVRRRIFEPLGMRASFTAADLPGIRRLAALYRFESGAWKAQADDFRGRRPVSLVPDDYEPGHNGVVYAPHGGMRVSALDLSRFLGALQSGGALDGARILRAGTVSLMAETQKVVKLTKDELYAVGLGLHLVSPYAQDSGLWVGHSGDASGLHSDMYFEDGGRHGVVLAVNGVEPAKPGQPPMAFREQLSGAVLRHLRGETPR